MERQWYIISGGRQVGPMGAAELRSHGLTPDSMVWTAGMPDWRPARECADLAPLLGGNPGGCDSGCVDVQTEESPHYSQNVDVESGSPSAGVGAHAGGAHPSYGYGPGARRVADSNNPGNWAGGNYGGYGNSGGYDSYGGGYGMGGNGGWSGKSKIVAGLLAILLGYLGVQYFYCGKVGGGFLTILLSLVTCGMWYVITLIQGIYMLTLSDRDFDNKFVYTTSTFPIF